MLRFVLAAVGLRIGQHTGGRPGEYLCTGLPGASAPIVFSARSSIK